MRERKRETNSFLVTRLGCDSFIDRRKRRMTYVAMTPTKKTCFMPSFWIGPDLSQTHYWKNPPCPVVAGGWSLLS